MEVLESDGAPLKLEIGRVYPAPNGLPVLAKVPPETEEWGDKLASKTMEIAPTGMVVGVRATRRPSRHRRLDGSEAAGTCRYRDTHESLTVSGGGSWLGVKIDVLRSWWIGQQRLTPNK